MHNVTMYTTKWCPYCKNAEALLRQKGVTHIDKINVDSTPEGWQKMVELTGRRTVPQIYIGDTHVGGFDDLTRLDKKGQLHELLFG